MLSLLPFSQKLPSYNLCIDILTCICTKWGLGALKGQDPVLVAIDRRERRVAEIGELQTDPYQQ